MTLGQYQRSTSIGTGQRGSRQITSSIGALPDSTREAKLIEQESCGIDVSFLSLLYYSRTASRLWPGEQFLRRQNGDRESGTTERVCENGKLMKDVRDKSFINLSFPHTLCQMKERCGGGRR